MNAVTHDANVNQVRIGGHEGILAGVSAVFIQYSGANVCAGLRIKRELEVVLLVMDHILHL